MTLQTQMQRAQPTRSLEPIITAHLFPALEAELLKLLASLSPYDWERQTAAPKWKVKDVASHLLDTQLRKLSLCRDGYAPETAAIASQTDLVSLINDLNERGVSLYRRLSPRVLISLMEVASRESASYHLSLNPMDKSMFSVSWAGETESANWFDTAREFTERWHHQQQIRLATGNDKPGIMRRDFYHPVLDCFMRALPFHYRSITRPKGTHSHFHIAGDCGGSWYLLRDDDAWRLVPDAAEKDVSRTVIPQEFAWRIFTKAIRGDDARARVEIEGDAELGGHILNMIAIVG
ncbi:MAG TPA: maleylpyruvate isomerase N-terminal domain-containing protein [Candidatus Angelobacter sp.]|nr:maleylpyruvate isomerase N-terminal domain-containing protein [Candidatus Angelobacter sp.]